MNRKAISVLITSPGNGALWKKSCWFNKQEKRKLPSLWLQGQLRNHFFWPNSAAGRLQTHFSSFGVAIKTLQGVCFAFSASFCQKSGVTQASPQMHHPVNGCQEWSEHRKAVDSSWQHKSHQQRQRQCHSMDPKRRKPLQKPDLWGQVPSQIKECYSCLVPPPSIRCLPCTLPITASGCNTLPLHRENAGYETGHQLLAVGSCKKNHNVCLKPSQYISLTLVQTLLLLHFMKEMLLGIVCSNYHVSLHHTIARVH